MTALDWIYVPAAILALTFVVAIPMLVELEFDMRNRHSAIIRTLLARLAFALCALLGAFGLLGLGLLNTASERLREPVSVLHHGIAFQASIGRYRCEELRGGLEVQCFDVESPAAGVIFNGWEPADP